MLIAGNYHSQRGGDLRRFYTQQHPFYCGIGRCFRSVESSSDGDPKCIAIDEEAQHQIVQRCCCGETNRATHETLDPGAQLEVLAFDLLRMRFANRGLRGINMALGGSPPIGLEAADVKRR
jgi:hypothetical protein